MCPCLNVTSNLSLHVQAGPSFLDIAVTEIPTHTPEDIEQHEHWYVEYCTLLDSKKKAIVKWKKAKEVREIISYMFREKVEIHNTTGSHGISKGSCFR